MKKHFDFTLTGKKFLPIWLTFYILVILPYVFYYRLLTASVQEAAPNPMIGFLLLGIVLGWYIVSFYVVKISIENIKYSNSQVKFEGKFATYVWKILSGLFLSIITLTVYMAWFVRDLVRFTINNSSVGDSNFEFQGKGGKLFVIFMLTLLLPLVLLVTLMGKHMIAINQTFIYSLIYQGVVSIIMIPYIYLVYNWMINIKFKDYQIKWQTEFVASCLKILVETLLIVVTLGIYMPLGYLKLYKYFVEKTVAESGDKTLRFGYELDAKGDSLFIWGQMLLTIITVGVYYPWAYSKVWKRILEKTYSVDDSLA